MDILGEWDYTANHLEEVQRLLESIRPEIPQAFGSNLSEIENDNADGHPLLKLTFDSPQVSGSWVCVYLARFGRTYTSHIDKCADKLKGFQRAKYSMWMVRAKEISNTELPKDRMFFRVYSTLDIGKLRAAQHLLDKRSEYEKNGTWAAAWKIIFHVVDSTYLGELLKHARERVQNLTLEVNSDSQVREAGHE